MRSVAKLLWALVINSWLIFNVVFIQLLCRETLFSTLILGFRCDIVIHVLVVNCFQQ